MSCHRVEGVAPCVITSGEVCMIVVLKLPQAHITHHHCLVIVTLQYLRAHRDGIVLI